MADEADFQKLSRPERNFALEVKRLREALELSQSQLAEQLRGMELAYMNQATISRIENATRPVRLMESQALSRLFKRTVAQMTDPDGTELHLGFVELNMRHYDVTRGKALDLVWEVSRDQGPAGDDLNWVLSTFGDGGHLDPDTRDRYTALIARLETFCYVDLEAQVLDAIRSGSESERSKDPQAFALSAVSTSERRLTGKAADLSATLRDLSADTLEARSSQRG